MKKAVMYGGGNIGRGFIGTVFRQSGYAVTFIDVSDAVVDGLNARHEYPLRIVASDGHEDFTVDNVCAVHGQDTEAVAAAIADADIMATAVGVNVLKFIVPNLVAGIRERFAVTDRPLNIIICENLLDADKILAGMLKEHLTPEEQVLFDERIGLVEASIGRMVPVQTDVMKDGDALRVCVERYAELPVDSAAFKGDIPALVGLVPFSPFGYYIKRKLFIHNMGHATCAYLGLEKGYEYIWQAVGDAEIYSVARSAMHESAEALARAYDMHLDDLHAHVDDLLTRFSNRALGDTCARVGGDTVRKLGENDRLVGAARFCEAQGVACEHIAVGITAAARLHFSELTGLRTEEALTQRVLALCGRRP